MRRLGPCAIALACACSHAPAAVERRPAFLELESEHFSLVTDVPERDGRETLRQLEDVRAALLEGSWRRALPAGEKLRVLQFRSGAELHEFASPGMDAFYQRIDLFGEPMLVMSTEQGPAHSAVLKHELAHALHAGFLLRTPRWFSEGMACYLETLRYDALTDRYVIGEPSAPRLAYLRMHPEIDFARMLSMSTREAVLLRDDGYAFQSAGWLAVFYLANERRTQLDAYIQRLAQGDDPEKAFAAVGLSREGLVRALVPYRETQTRRRIEPTTWESDYRFSEVHLVPWRGEVRVGALAPADVEALRAELFFLSPGIARAEARVEQAAEAADAALRLDPAHPLALAVHLAMSPTGDNPALLGRIRSAAASRPDDFRAQLLLALALPRDEASQQRDALARAAALAPRNAPVLNALAWHDVTHGRVHDALPVAEEAARLAPGNAAVLDTLATALAVSSRCPEATRVEERAIEIAGERASAEFRRQMLARLDAMRAGCGAVPLEY